MEVKLKKQFLYRVQNDSEQEMIKNFNTDKTGIVRNNTEYPIFCGEYVQVNVNNFKTHFVKPAQTIDDIAKIYNLSVNKILCDNDLSSQKLFIGQRLKIFKD